MARILAAELPHLAGGDLLLDLADLHPELLGLALELRDGLGHRLEADLLEMLPVLKHLADDGLTEVRHKPRKVDLLGRKVPLETVLVVVPMRIPVLDVQHRLQLLQEPWLEELKRVAVVWCHPTELEVEVPHVWLEEGVDRPTALVLTGDHVWDGILLAEDSTTTVTELMVPRELEAPWLLERENIKETCLVEE